MIAKTLTIIVATSKNISWKAWYLVCITYHDGVDGEVSIPFPSNIIRSKYLKKEAMVLPCNNGRALLDRDNFIKWNDNWTT